MILFSTLIWAPVSQVERVQVIHKHLDCVELALNVNVKEHPASLLDVLFVINGCEEGDDPSIMDRIEGLKSLYNCKSSYHLPQLGWAKGRNYSICKFLENPLYDRLVMSDCDQYFADSSWVNKIMELHKKAPTLHAYMIRPDKYQCHAHSKFNLSNNLHDGSQSNPNVDVSINRNNLIDDKSYIILDMYEEWLGTSNVIDQRVAREVGGYDCVAFPQHWGFHDAHYGQRLKKSGLLKSTLDWYVDPIRIEGEHLDCENYQDYLVDIKNEGLSYNRSYIQEVSLLKSNLKPYYFDPETGIHNELQSNSNVHVSINKKNVQAIL